MLIGCGAASEAPPVAPEPPVATDTLPPATEPPATESAAPTPASTPDCANAAAVAYGGDAAAKAAPGVKNWSGCNLTLARLAPANLTRADLAPANQTRADLWYAILKDADLTGADLTDADMRFATGVPRNHDKAIYSHTICPNETLRDTDCWAP